MERCIFHICKAFQNAENGFVRQNLVFQDAPRQSSIVNRQSSIVNRQSSIVNRQSSIVNHKSPATCPCPCPCPCPFPLKKGGQGVVPLIIGKSSLVNRPSSIINRPSSIVHPFTKTHRNPAKRSVSRLRPPFTRLKTR
jgi:hypothetical protein